MVAQVVVVVDVEKYLAEDVGQVLAAEGREDAVQSHFDLQTFSQAMVSLPVNYTLKAVEPVYTLAVMSTSVNGSQANYVIFGARGGAEGANARRCCSCISRFARDNESHLDVYLLSQLQHGVLNEEVGPVSTR